MKCATLALGDHPHILGGPALIPITALILRFFPQLITLLATYYSTVIFYMLVSLLYQSLTSRFWVVFISYLNELKQNTEMGIT